MVLWLQHFFVVVVVFLLFFFCSLLFCLCVHSLSPMLPQKGDPVIPPLILTALHNLKRGFRSYFAVQSLGTRTKMNINFINLLIYLGGGEDRG